jgi:polyvinyl alcohol dehydrogenase (cytochrome)
MYGFDDGHTGYDPVEPVINPGRLWTMHHMYVSPDFLSLTGQFIRANNLTYFGAWDGYERAIPLHSPDPIWKTYLGITYASCRPYTDGKNPGVAGTAAAVTVNGAPTLFVGGGDAQLYALNALTGAVKWHTRLGSSPDHFIWSSPVVYNGSVYIGLASTADCPMVGGQVFKLDAQTGAIQAQFSTVPQGCTGGEIWDAVSIYDDKGMLYVATGAPGQCSQPEPNADAIVALSAADLSVLGSWQVPASQRTSHGGFRAAPTLFRVDLLDGGHIFVGAGNKNGVFYALDTRRLSAGPVWQRQVANPGGCLNYMCTAGDTSLTGWDGNLLYVGGGATTLGGKACPGSVHALDPATGKVIWQNCYADGDVTGVSVAGQGAGEVVMICAGFSIVIVPASSGQQTPLQSYMYEDPEFMNFFAPVSSSDSVMFWPNVDGGIHQTEVRAAGGSYI